MGNYHINLLQSLYPDKMLESAKTKKAEKAIEAETMELF